jgi:hypothetical protein
MNDELERMGKEVVTARMHQWTFKFYYPNFNFKAESILYFDIFKLV